MSALLLSLPQTRDPTTRNENGSRAGRTHHVGPLETSRYLFLGWSAELCYTQDRYKIHTYIVLIHRAYLLNRGGRARELTFTRTV